MSPAFFRNAGRADRLAVLSALVAIIAVALSTVFTPAAVEAQTPVPQAVCPVGGGCGGQPWLQYRGDAARSGRGIWTHASAEQAAVVWQAQLGSMRASSPVVGSGPWPAQPPAWAMR